MSFIPRHAISGRQGEISVQVNDIIRSIISTETEVEDLKVTLAENIRFDTADAFRSIDRNQKGYITADDVFRFMTKNTYAMSVKMCNFMVHTVSNGQTQITYQQFLLFMIPRYDRDAAQQCIARKLFQESDTQTLSFYLEESVARMLNIELEYLKELEIKKMRLAQTVEWKFMTVYKLIATGSPNQSIDAPLLNAFMRRYGFPILTDAEFTMFLTRFNRNEDKLIQRDEFSDAIFPSGYLLEYDSKADDKDDFQRYIKNQNQELDDYLGKTHLNDLDDENNGFNPDDHRFSIKRGEAMDALVVDNRQARTYLLQNPHQTISKFTLPPAPDQDPYRPPPQIRYIPPPINRGFRPPFNNTGNDGGPIWPDSVLPDFGIVSRSTWRPGKNTQTPYETAHSPEPEPPIQPIAYIPYKPTYQRRPPRQEVPPQEPWQQPKTAFWPVQHQQSPSPEKEKDILAQFYSKPSSNNQNYQDPVDKSSYMPSQVFAQEDNPQGLHYANPSAYMSDSLTKSKMNQYLSSQPNRDQFLGPSIFNIPAAGFGFGHH